MITDLLLALASVAVLLSPFVMEAGYSLELRRSTEERKAPWDKKLLT